MPPTDPTLVLILTELQSITALLTQLMVVATQLATGLTGAKGN